MSEKMIQSKNATLCTESFGDPSHPTLLLIMGAQSSIIWWGEIKESIYKVMFPIAKKVDIIHSLNSMPINSYIFK